MRRSNDDRVIAGVCGGLGRYCGVDPIIFRIVLAVLAVFGGVGLLVYALAWLFVPDDVSAESDGRRLLRGHGTLHVLLAAVVGIIGVLTLVDLVDHHSAGPILVVVILAAFVGIVATRSSRRGAVAGSAAAGVAFAPPPAAPWSTAPLGPPAGYAPSRPSWAVPPPPPPRPPRQPSMLAPLALSLGVIVTGVLFALDASHSIGISVQAIVAAALLTIGLALVIGTWIGRGRALIGVGIVLTLALIVTAALDVPLRGGIGNRLDDPTSTSQLPTSYHLGLGREDLDLAALQLGGRRVHVASTLGLGHLYVEVPDNVTVVVHARAGAGQLLLFGADPSGTQLSRTATAQATGPSRGEIDLDLRVGAGEIEVVRVPAAPVGG